ncbi:MAG: alpha/beta hydrolase [Myxococcales bacterium]|nr:alpha/beta hydrolase [Myxococcales bacterium]HIK86263.1 alpha/beta hydrolase [Myxococcales bacterium]
MPLDPEAKAVLDSLAEGLDVDPFSVPHTVMRDAFAAQSGENDGPEVGNVEMREADGPEGKIPVRVYTPASSGTTPVGQNTEPASSQTDLRPGLLFFHGGGFVLCDLDSHDSTCRELANGADCVVVSVDYRLAPESKFPAAPEDCYAATEWVAKNAASLGIDANRIAVSGDSAGGNLAAAVTLMCRDRNGPKLVHQLLIYPVTDNRFDTASYKSNGVGYFLTEQMMRWFWDHYLESESDGDDALASPLRAPDLGRLPSATVVTAQYDPLRDEGRAYARRLAEAGVATTQTDYPGVFHGFFGMSGQIPRARQAIEQVCAELREAFAA